MSSGSFLPESFFCDIILDGEGKWDLPRGFMMNLFLQVCNKKSHSSAGELESSTGVLRCEAVLMTLGTPPLRPLPYQ